MSNIYPSRPLHLPQPPHPPPSHIHNHSHPHHHHRGPRRRSTSRSSSSPSPPATPRSNIVPGVHGSGGVNGGSGIGGGSKEKRRSFHTQRPFNGSASGLASGLNSNSNSNLNPPNASQQTFRGRPLSWGENQFPSSSSSKTPYTPSPISNGFNIDDLEINGSSTNPSPIIPYGEEHGFSTPFGESTSSKAGVSASSDEGDYFVSALGEETEVEERRKGRIRDRRDSVTPPVSFDKPKTDRISPPLSTHRPSFSARRGLTIPTPMPKRVLLPYRIGFFPKFSEDSKQSKKRQWGGYVLTRRRCEDGLLLGAVGFGICKLVYEWEEFALAGEIGLLLGLSVIYITFRRCPRQPSTIASAGLAPRPNSPSFHSQNGNNIRERSSRPSTNSSHLTVNPKDDTKRPSSLNIESVQDVEMKGCIWGTEDREYRDCPDDGALFAILLTPLIASAMLHSSLTQLSTNPPSPLPASWHIEDPLVLPSTPLRDLRGIFLNPTDSIRALSALTISRRNLVQLFTLLSFVLLVHLARSMHLVHKQSKIIPPIPSSTAMEKENSDNAKHGSTHGHTSSHATYWLRKGEWRRTKSVVGFAFLVTGGCIVVKIATAYIGHGVWSDMSLSDIIIATLFYQFSLYVCVRLARRGFTLGELAVVCNAATALFMETVNMTRMKIRILRTPYIKTYRLPTPLLTFQLALIPGSLLTGFLLSPLLYLSRHLAQRPAHRLRFPHEKPIHRRLLAIGFYAGAALVCGGLVGSWTKWCLNWRDPFVWITFWILEGKHWWTRPILLSYWGILAIISVAGWNRQLNRARRHRKYHPPGRPPSRNDRTNNSVHSTGSSKISTTTVQPTGGEISSGSGFSQIMDAADQRMPTLSVNSRRKFFHALAVVMFVPGIAIDPAFTHLSFSVAFALFNFAEYVRYFALWPFGVSVHLFLNEFLDSKDSGTAIVSHFYLLAGCAAPLWLEGSSEILSQFGVLSLGIGDALASIVGRRLGKLRWSNAGGKTVEGSTAFLASVVISAMFLWAIGLIKAFNLTSFVITTTLSTLLEAFSYQNDNLILPMYGWALGTLLGV